MTVLLSKSYNSIYWLSNPTLIKYSLFSLFSPFIVTKKISPSNLPLSFPSWPEIIIVLIY